MTYLFKKFKKRRKMMHFSKFGFFGPTEVDFGPVTIAYLVELFKKVGV